MTDSTNAASPPPAQPCRPTWKRIGKVALALVVLAAAALACRGIDIGAVVRPIGSVGAVTLAVVLACALAQALALATRFWAVFPHGSRPKWMVAARAFGFGQMLNAWLPARAGDVLKVVAITKHREESPRATAAEATGVMLADKALDMVTLVALTAALSHALLARMAVGAVHAAPFAGAAASAIAIAYVVVHRVWPAAIAKLRAGVRATAVVFRTMLTPKRLVSGLGLGFVAWLLEAAALVLLAHGMGAHLTLAQGMMSLLVLNVGISIPLTVANVGAYEAATVVGLAPFGVEPHVALAIGTLHHAAQLATVIAFAAVFWLRDRVRRASVSEPPRAVCAVDAA